MLWEGGRDAGREGERIKGGRLTSMKTSNQSQEENSVSHWKIQGRDRKFAYLDICLPATLSGQ